MIKWYKCLSPVLEDGLMAALKHQSLEFLSNQLFPQKHTGVKNLQKLLNYTNSRTICFSSSQSWCSKLTFFFSAMPSSAAFSFCDIDFLAELEALQALCKCNSFHHVNTMQLIYQYTFKLLDWRSFEQLWQQLGHQIKHTNPGNR